MLLLNSRNIQVEGFAAGTSRQVLRLRAPGIDATVGEAVLAAAGAELPPGKIVFALERDVATLRGRRSDTQIVILPDDFEYLGDGDVVSLAVDRPAVRALYRRRSLHNSFLLTERCNHYCLMCSQPPKDVNDDWLVDEILSAIPLISPETGEIGFTGGEPTLLGDRFLALVRSMRDHLPSTALHILSNGRRFVDLDFARAYAEIGHPDVMVGIPLYSATSHIHDYVVQADGAFDETVRGILNLKSLGQQVEIRVVVHKQNYAGLPALAEFIGRNLTFVDHVTFMGLEMTGFAKANIDQLWIDPVDYRNQLYLAASLVDDLGLRTSIYNHQLCTVDSRIIPLATQSISDWKNEYVEECDGCTVKATCGGFFSTGRVRRSEHIRAIR